MNAEFKTATDFRKSLETRLQLRSAKTGEDLQRLRRKVAFDRFLARIFSQEHPGFYLKGGYAMELRIAKARATKDIDLTWIRRAKNASDLTGEMIRRDLQSLSSIDMNDHFLYQIGKAQIDLENAPYGGSRFPVASLIDGKIFVRFQLDVGADFLLDQIETIQATHWLEFCKIPAPQVSMISIEQQFAEKLHAYTLPRPERINSRVKDLIDMILLLNMRTIQVKTMARAIQAVFKKRDTHLLPTKLESPPLQWQDQFSAMAGECGLSLDLHAGFQMISEFYHRILV